MKKTNCVRFYFLFLILFCFSTGSIFAADMYWRSQPVSNLYSNRVNWVTNPAEIDLPGEELSSTPAIYPGANDVVHFTGPSTYTTLTGIGCAMHTVVCTAGVTYTLPDATIYGSIESNGNLRVTGNVTMTGPTAATIDLGTSDIIRFGNQFTINKPGAQIDLQSNFNRDGVFTFTNGLFYSNGYDMTALVVNIASAGTVNLSAGTTLNLTATTYASQFYQADFPACDVVCSNPYINFYPSSVQFKSFTALNPSGLQLYSYYQDIRFSVADLIIQSPLLSFMKNVGGSQGYSFNEITISNQLEFKQASNLIINQNVDNFTTPVPVNINSIVLPADAGCAKRSALIGYTPLTVKATGAPIATEYLTYQNITFDSAGAAFIASEADDAGLNAGHITWTAAASTDYYWIGGTGDWADPAHWAVGSFAGSSNGCVPSAVDNVFFGTDAADYTVTLSVSAGCNHISWADGNKRGTLAASDGASLSIRGNANFSGAKAINPTLYFLGRDDLGSYTINSGSEPVYNSPNIFFWHRGTYRLTSDFKMITKNCVDHSSGILVSNGYTLDIGRFASFYAWPAGATRTLNLSGSTINCTRNSLNQNSRPYSIYLSDSGMDGYDFSSSHFRLINDERQQILRVEGAFAFNDISFDSDCPVNQLQFNSLGSSINHLTFTGNGTMGQWGFTVNTLTLSPFKTYTFPYYYNNATNRTVTITGDLVSTSGCETITIQGASSTTQTGIIQNSSNKAFSIPGANISNMTYIGRESEVDDALTVSGGIDAGENTNVTVTALPPRTFYWIGDGGDWSDPGHWSFTSGTANNPENCIPGPADVVYFDGGSFSNPNEVVTLDISPVSITSMFWLPEAGAKTPQLNMNAKTLNLSGSLTFAEGMTTSVPVIDGVISTVNFTGTKSDPSSQVIDTKGIYTGYFLNITGTGRFDLNSKLSAEYYTTINCGSLYTHGHDLYSRVQFEMTQSGSSYYDLSTSTITSENTIRITITDCSTFFSEEASLVGYYVYITNLCPAKFRNITHVSNLAGNLTYPVTAEKITSGGSGYSPTITGLFVTDIWDVIGATTTLAANSQITVNEEIITYGTPCAHSVIQGTDATSKLKFTYCNPELHFLNMGNITAELLPADQCEGEAQTLKVYGQALPAGNNTNVTFLDPLYGTDLYTYPPHISACNPYVLDIVKGQPTKFEWFKVKDDGETDAITGATARTYAATESGTYMVLATYSTGCVGRLEQTITFDSDRTWTAAGAANDWNDPLNWAPQSVPDLCSYVIIPGGLGHYPILQAEQEDVYEAAKCDTIEFRFGGMVKNTQHLTYTSAKVEQSLNANQWYMLSAPLHDMYTGDFYITDPNPVTDGYFMEPMAFNADNPQTGVYSSTWTGRFNNADYLYQAGQGFALWIDKRGTDFGDHDLTSMWFPKEDDYYNYYNYGGGIIGQTGTLDRSQNGRFIYEGLLDGNKDLVLAASDCAVAGDPVLVGNPFMAHLDFASFATRNTTMIQDQFKLASGVSTQDGKIKDFVSYTWDSGSSKYVSTGYDPIPAIAPMQSFIVISRQTDPGLVIKANVEADTKLVPGNVLRSAESLPQTLTITANRNNEVSMKALILYRDYASNAYAGSEDSYKLFPASSTEPVLIYTRSKDGYALDINSIGDCKEIVPLGIRTSKQGAIALSFDGMDSFDDTDVYLIDTYANHRVNLTTTDSYRFNKDDDALYLDDRFYLSFVSRSTTGMDASAANFSIYNQGSDIHVLNPSGGTLRAYIYSVSGNCLLQEAVSGYKPTIHTRLSQGVYIIKLVSEKEVSTKTITIK